MTYIRRAILALALIAGITPAMAQVPPPVPALPDTERRTSYSISTSTCACNVDFALYGDSTDYQNWVEVFINGVRANYNDPTFGWTITSPTGPLANIARPVTDGVLTFTNAQTGTIQIVGARRPRRVSQFNEGQGVPARNLNQALTDIIAQNREIWDKTNDMTGRGAFAPPGETLALLPPLASRQNMGACFDSSGNLNSCVAASSGSFAAGSGIVFTGTNPTTISSNPGTVPQLSGNNGWSGNNTYSGQSNFNGDTLFGSGRPWCDVRAKGAVGDGVTDDSPAFAACVTTILASYGSGTVFVPTSGSVYCLFSGVTVSTGLTTNGGIIIQGGGEQGTNLSTCNHNVGLMRLNNQWASVRDMTLLGYGSLGGDAVFTTALPLSPTLLLDAGCAFCTAKNVFAIGGTAAIQTQGSNYLLDNVSTASSYGDGAHTFGMFYAINGGGWIINSHFDQIFPGPAPAHGSGATGWTASTSKSAGAIVSVSCSGRTWFLQATAGGTTGSSQPSCKNYGQPITDATVTWALLKPGTYYCAQYDTGVNEAFAIQTDFTCTADANIAITNTFAGTGPTQVHLQHVTPGLGFSENVLIASGTQIHLTDVETSFCLFSGCSGIVVGSAFTSILNIEGTHCLNNFATCITLNGGNNINIRGMITSGSDTQGVLVAAGVSSWSLTGSTFASGTGNLINVTTGSSDHYVQTGNLCNGTGISDGGTGTHKTWSTCP